MRELFPDVPAPPPLTSSGGTAAGRVEVDLRATFPWLAQSLVCPAIDGAVVLGCLAAAAAGRRRLMRPVQAGMFLFKAAVYGAGAAWSLWCGRVHEAMVSAMTVATPILMIWVIWRRERYSIIVFFVPFFQSSLALPLARLVAFHSVASLLPGGGAEDVHAADNGAALYFHLWYLAGVAFLWLRRRDVRRARELLDPDRARYDAVWAAECTRPGTAAALAGIATAAAALAARAAAAGPPLQLNRCRAAASRCSAGSVAGTASPINVVPPPAPLHAPAARGGGKWGKDGVGRGWMWIGSFQGIGDCGAGLPGTLDPGRPVDSVDQLFAAAAAAHPFLLERVRAWAAESGGRFPAEGGRTGAGARGAGLKSVERALEKIVRVYQQVGGGRWGGRG
jgi:hypothetical protein